ncbi:phage tail tape measure protein [Streptomyces sp. NBC_01275]|uniref:phage tail tape measure protein n=1 Tax=Streptomyces sp. NBC_01275 TaxID=2903807 RepID=UPI0022508EC8|nr:phage tail tape measure protein [Streptomyces sp. NBC_01275]MCX4761907.1 phage tail tape measure protein [Streptomyces sp. NBC_01275]
MTGAYSLYVNMMANFGNLTSGLRTGATQLRAFDGQLAGVDGRLNQVQTATRQLARAQAAASAQMVRSHAQVSQAAQRAAWAQQVAARAQAVAAQTAARAQAAAAAQAAAGERAARALTLAQTMAARAAAATGQGAAAAARTSAAAQVAATRAAQDQVAAQARTTAVQAAAARAAGVVATSEVRARNAVAGRDEAQRVAARNAAASAQSTARAEAVLAAARTQRAVSLAQTGLIISAVLGVGVANAIDLEKAMANVLTISRQITGDTVGQFTDQIVELSTELPQTAEQLAEGLYQVVSTGFDGAEAMTILEVSARGAAAGLTTSETSARALLGVLKAYGLEAADATDVMDVMFQTVNLGVISYEDLAQQLGDVVPMAAAAGVEFDDLSSALAAITLSGIPAAESATALNMLMTRLMKPTRELKAAIRELGYESTASAVEQDGLYVVVNKLNQASGGSAENLANLWHDIRATRAALALAAADGQNYADTYAGIASEVERAGATQRAYDVQMDTTAGQWQLFSNQARAVGIDLGRAMLPALQAVGEALNVFAGAVNELPGPVKSLAAGLGVLVAATLIARAAFTKLSLQVTAFRTNLAATRAGGALLPTVLSGAGLAVSGLTALLAVGTLGYAAYTASKQEAKDATEELVEALKAEGEQEGSGLALRKLVEQITGGDDLDTLKDAGVDINDAIDAITSGGAKLSALKARLDQDSLEYSGKVRSGEEPGGVENITKFSKAKKALDERRKIWNESIKDYQEQLEQERIIGAKIRQQATTNAAWNLDQLIPLDKNGAPQYTEEMKALATAVGDAVDPSRAFKDAQTQAGEAMRKAGKDAADAKVSLRDYMKELRTQAEAQRDFQSNLSELAIQGYGDLTGHFAELGVDSAPMLAELVKNLKAGKTEIADEMQAIVTEDAARSTEAYKQGLDLLPAIAAQYGEKIAREWAKASETNDPAAFARVTSKMAFSQLGEAAKASSADARQELERGMELIAEVARRKGADSAAAFKNALLDGRVEEAMGTLQAIWGADADVKAPNLAGVVGAFRTVGKDAREAWAGMLDLITVVSREKGSQAAASLTSALLSGDMAAVQAQLDAIGVSVQNIPGSKTVTVNVTANQPPPVVVPLVIKRQATSWDRDADGVPDSIQAPKAQADGSVLEFYADGGVRKERHVAQIAPAGSMRIWAEKETGGEAYVPLAESKRPRSKAIVGEVVRRFGGQVEWYAGGGLTDWSYNTPELFSLSGIAGDSKDKKDRFSSSKFVTNLHKSVTVARRWRSDLDTVARRAGQDVADALAEMGEDGVDLTRKMATGSSQYVKAMTKDLEALAATAKASLSSYTSQLKAAVKDQQAFEKNIAKLAAMGYTDLAGMLAEQGDQDAEDLAAQAVKSPKKAKNANTAAKSSGATLPDEDLADLVKIIGAIKSSKTGIHAVAEATELDEDHIIDVASAGRARIKGALGKKADTFLSDLAKANKHLAYGYGGVLTPGIYATSNGVVKFAEPETGGEAFVPLGADRRAAATAVLGDVARRFGYQLTPNGVTGPVSLVDARPASSVQVIVVREQPAALVGSMPVTVNGTADANTADRVGTEIMRRLRNAQRGGRI